MAVPVKLQDLPFKVIHELCRYLDNPIPLHHSGWKGLLSKVPGKIYNVVDVSEFERVGQRPNGSPTEAVIQDFIMRGFTVDDLYLMLTGMGLTEGRRAIQDYVSPYLLETQENSIQQPFTISSYLLGTQKDSIQQPFTISEPILKDLVKVKVKSWYNLGLELDIEDDDLQTIERNNPRDQDGCKRDMFRTWLQKCAQATYRQLVQALVELGQVSEADHLCRKHGLDMPQSRSL